MAEKEKKKLPVVPVVVFLLLLIGIGIGIGVSGVLSPSPETPLLTDESNTPAESRSEEETGIAADSANTGDDGQAATDMEAAGDKFDVEAYMADFNVDSKEAFISWIRENTDEPVQFLNQRWDWGQRLVGSREIVGETNLKAFLRTPREDFVRQRNYDRAYHDTWMPIGYGATITDPDVVAMMTTTLDVKAGDKILEIGTGSGYQSAILANLTNEVYTIEIIEPLFYETDELQISLIDDYPAYRSIHRKLADGFYGWEEYSPFDGIIVTCSIDHIPPPLLNQLADDGIMVVPLGPPGRQLLMEIRKEIGNDGNVRILRRDVYNGMGVSFIPFVDKEGNRHTNK